MRRHCNGEDPNLLMYVNPKTGDPCGSGQQDAHLIEPKAIPKPCDCGLYFDDVYRSTVYPHDRI